MRVLIDTNVLISAALSANGVPFRAYTKADVLLTGDKDYAQTKPPAKHIAPGSVCVDIEKAFIHNLRSA